MHSNAECFQICLFLRQTENAECIVCGMADATAGATALLLPAQNTHTLCRKVSRRGDKQFIHVQHGLRNCLCDNYPTVSVLFHARNMPVSMRGSTFVSFKHETKEEFEHAVSSERTQRMKCAQKSASKVVSGSHSRGRCRGVGSHVIGTCRNRFLHYQVCIYSQTDSYGSRFDGQPVSRVRAGRRAARVAGFHRQTSLF